VLRALSAQGVINGLGVAMIAARAALRNHDLPRLARTLHDDIHRTDPWLAMRLRLSRRFGLTKLEALTVDPLQGVRTWGLVVGQNLYVVSWRQRRAFERHRVDEALFFAHVSSHMLESLRQRPKWAFRAKQPLQAALAT
jgi:hypothetical protein